VKADAARKDGAARAGGGAAVSRTAQDGGPARPALLARLDQVSLRYGSHTVFSDLSLSLYRGEHLALLGANGSGKSSLLRLLQGELRPDQEAAAQGRGRIYWNFTGEEEPFALSALRHARLVSPGRQGSYARYAWRIRGEEIILSGLDNATLLHSPASGEERRLAAQLAACVGAEGLLEMTAPAMSQGQLRLLLLLRALISRPILLLLDEPFDGLDVDAREGIARCLRLAAEQGSSLVLSAHREEDVPAFIRAALILRGGRITRAELPLSARIDPAGGPCDRGARACGPGGDFSELAARAPAGGLSERAVAPGALQPRETRSGQAPLLELEHVNVFVDRRHVLHDISWSILPGEQWLLSGGNGAGKSTLLRLIHGEEFAACGGALRWMGGPRPSLEQLRSCVGYVSDSLQYAYDYDLSAEEVVISGLRGSIGLYRAPDERERALAGEWLDIMGIGAVRARNFFSLSSGQSRRVLLARALAASPCLLLLDEPCSGLDAPGRARFLHGLEQLAANGVSIIHVTHHERDISPQFTRELRLDKGRAIFCGEVSQRRR
jgi:molybdate transport system ATP-binding protein